MTTTPNPLVSFLMLSYNQEQYVRQALEAAFAQTYPNLEILISDDCSKDNTYRIVEEMVAAYTGPHKVVCLRNAENLGIARHVNKLNAMAKGELIIASACDDASLPTRTQEIVDVWQASGRSIHYFYSPAQEIGLDNTPFEVVSSPGASNAASVLRTGLSPYPLAIGATQAWTKVLRDAFPPIDRQVWAEDQILGFRGRLLGPVQCIGKPLVLYRIGSGISTTKSAFSFQKYLKGKVAEIRILRQRAADAWHVRQLFLAGAIGSKAAVLTVALPFSPFISLARKVLRA